jgi:probable F420-dependent oxidoreductase
MKIGVNLINFGPGADPASLLNWAQLSENLGYHMIMISDHVALTPDVQAQYPAPFYDPFATLAWLAGITRSILLGTTVIVLPYRNPLLVARMGANIDRFSRGRFILGVGAGWAQNEFDALNVPFHRRGAMTDEFLSIVKMVWMSDLASYDGEFISFKDVRTGPRPFQSPHPPIWVGGSSDAALRRAVRLGDAWHPIRIRIDWLRDTGLPRLKQIADAEGKSMPKLCPRIMLQLTDAPVTNAARVAGEGTIDQVHGDFQALQELGAECVLLDTYTGDIEATRRHEASWSMLAAVAEKIADLPHETLRR